MTEQRKVKTPAVFGRVVLEARIGVFTNEDREVEKQRVLGGN